MSARSLAPVLHGILVCAAVWSAGCVNAVRVDSADWGGIPPDETIRVHTTSGDEHDLTSVIVGESILTGVRSDPTGFPVSVRIPTDSIDFIEVRDPAVFKTALLPLVAGVAIAILVAQSEDDTRPVPEPVKPLFSCPFVYSFDGAEYRLDSETFAGAITRGLQRTDLDNLEHLVEVDGFYDLLLTNERPETQYTDALELLAMDHPEDTDVFPDAAGEPTLVADLRPPTLATGLHGGDARDAVRTQDGQMWLGAPLDAIDPQDDGPLRDGLDLTFPHPHTPDAILVVRGQNTALAPFALSTVLELQGDGLVDWYRAIDRGGAEREKVWGWVQREGMLQVHLWVGDRWQLQDALLDVGPHLAKTQVARIDLSEIAGDRVRIRLEAARGLWVYDWIALGADRTDEIEVGVAPLVHASAEGRSDLVRVLSHRDDVYYTSFQGDRVELRFQAPRPPAPGLSRSMLLRSSGYYHISTDHRGRLAQPDLVDRILGEPGFGGRYLLGLWRAEQSGAPAGSD